MSNDKVSIGFFDGQRKYAGRYWSLVPRVGDEVMLNAGERYAENADASGKAAFRVKRVVWGVEGPSDHCQCVNIEIEPITDN